MTDQEIIKAVKNGNDQAFREIVQRYEARVAATIIGMLGKCPEADDVGQEVFIRFYKSIDKFRGDASVGTYLTRIAINLTLNELKKRKRKWALFGEMSSNKNNEMAGPELSKPFDEEREIIQCALQKLEPKFRSVVVLRLMEGYSTKETANILKVPEGTVLSRLARAQMKLRVLLLPYFGGSNE